MKKRKMYALLLSAVMAFTPAAGTVPVTAYAEAASGDLEQQLADAQAAAETTASELKDAEAAKKRASDQMEADKKVLESEQAEQTAIGQKKQDDERRQHEAEDSLQQHESESESLQEQLSTASSEQADAQAEEAEKQADYESKTAAEEKAQTELDASLQKESEAKSVYDQADSDYQAAETAVSEAQQEYDQKAAAKKDADSKAAAAAENLTNAETAQSEKDAAYRDAEKKAESAKSDEAAKKEAHDQAEASYRYGSYGFFKSMNSQTAMDALTKCTYAGYIKIEGLGASAEEAAVDAASLDNMEASFQWMRKLNSMRSDLGLGELSVTDTMMAYAQADADYSDTVVAHAQQFRIGENVAWNYGSNPYDQWYDEEKAIFDQIAKDKFGKTGLLGKEAFDFYSANEETF